MLFYLILDTMCIQIIILLLVFAIKNRYLRRLNKIKLYYIINTLYKLNIFKFDYIRWNYINLTIVHRLEKSYTND